jgi:hypothetical protein
MLRLFARSRLYNPIRKNFIKSSPLAIARTIATRAANNEDLKINKLFDVSNFSAVVTRGVLELAS